MSHSMPYHRNLRPLRASGSRAGYSSAHFTRDPKYAQNPTHFVRAFLLIQDDIQTIFEYLEPSDECLNAYSYRIHALLMRTCIEIEANFKAILEENIFTPSGKYPNMMDYRKVDVTHHLSSYEVVLPIWNDQPKTFVPFAPWRAVRGQANSGSVSLPWYKAYNASKHDRHYEFKQANFANLLESVAALLVLVSSQFGNDDFNAGPNFLLVDLPQTTEPTIGSLFRIKYPNDWAENEMYDFNWGILNKQAHRFAKFNFDEIPR